MTMRTIGAGGVAAAKELPVAHPLTPEYFSLTLPAARALILRYATIANSGKQLVCNPLSR